ncbi:ParB/RepB/Spo0J family partition protein [Geminocystis sp. NIES-3709]|uniref:ParB/RepB/Spo0J family partition protein n=1 Tax=Geminocystis sp. NIES-3709 TaxID=1617448 RepID=UPI0005FCC8AB|nr:ParB/RepB/Spo0J family partition protein [Geminocystis sp. NIES-3709]BAQ67018.1 chromosome (plasmid) partitioning protein ParB [Geminocystis sp. NIES-3709]
MTTKRNIPSPERNKLKNISLFTDEEKLNPSSIAIEKIKLPSSQPRRYFSPQSMETLIASVKKDGILQPLLVRPIVNDEYELVAGERRYRAAQTIGLLEVPVVVREMSDLEATQYALTENLQREDLNPVEETEAILNLLALNLDKAIPEVISLLNQISNSKRGLTNNVVRKTDIGMIEDIFKTLGKLSLESFRTHRLPLLNLSTDILDSLRQGEIAYTKAIVLAKVKNEQQRKELLSEVISKNLSLSEIKERIKQLQPQKESNLAREKINKIVKNLNQSKMWEKEPKKWQKLEKLLDKIELLLDE